MKKKKWKTILVYLKSGMVTLKWILRKERGRAVAQAVSRWLPTSAARVRVRAACEICGGQSGTEAGFPYQSSFHQFLHHHNHPVLAQYAYWWPQGRVDAIGLHLPLYQFKKGRNAWVWPGLSNRGQGTEMGSFEYGNELSEFIRQVNFLASWAQERSSSVNLVTYWVGVTEIIIRNK
jgi:hypothetical protein